MQLSKALLIIVGSTLIVSGSAYTLTTLYKNKLKRRLADEDYQISLIVQTGPQKCALPTQYLAELLDLSIDEPQNLYAFSISNATQKLLASPLIESASIKPIKPSALYIDYKVRVPIAKLGNISNTGIDRTGHQFPLEPYLSPKILPDLFLSSTHDVNQALCIFEEVNHRFLNEQFVLERLDLSEIDAPSAGRQQIVAILLDEGHRRILRLSPKRYHQDINNYFSLRKTLSAKENIVDLRLAETAFISN
ncbi:MAG: hypothetical protein H7A40_00730 [Chlamydiales bacterium]|nr:hypothetical protein [Chlamydiales bacterium]